MGWGHSASCPDCRHEWEWVSTGVYLGPWPLVRDALNQVPIQGWQCLGSYGARPRHRLWDHQRETASAIRSAIAKPMPIRCAIRKPAAAPAIAPNKLWLIVMPRPRPTQRPISNRIAWIRSLFVTNRTPPRILPASITGKSSAAGCLASGRLGCSGSVMEE
jgi:hypothetical protein